MIIIYSMSLLVYIYLLILCNIYGKILYLIYLRNLTSLEKAVYIFLECCLAA